MKINNWEIIKNDIELRSFKNYLLELSQYLEKQDGQLEAQWNIAEKENNDDFKEYLQDQYQVVKKYRETLYFSYIVAIYSYIEQELDYIAETLSRQNTVTAIKPKELSGKGCSRSILFLDKVCRLTMPSDVLHKHLDFIGKIRNSFVHNSCKVSWKEEYINYVSKNIKGISFEKDNLEECHVIKINKDFCFFATDIIYQYLLDLVTNNHDGPYSYELSYN